MADFNQIMFILKLRIYSRQILKYYVLLYLKCYKKSLPKGVNILLGQPVYGLIMKVHSYLLIPAVSDFLGAHR